MGGKQVKALKRQDSFLPLNAKSFVCTWLFLTLFHPRHISSRDQELTPDGVCAPLIIKSYHFELDWRRQKGALIARFLIKPKFDCLSTGQSKEQIQVQSLFQKSSEPSFIFGLPSSIESISWELISTSLAIGSWQKDGNRYLLLPRARGTTPWLLLKCVLAQLGSENIKGSNALLSDRIGHDQLQAQVATRPTDTEEQSENQSLITGDRQSRSEKGSLAFPSDRSMDHVDESKALEKGIDETASLVNSALSDEPASSIVTSKPLNALDEKSGIANQTPHLHPPLSEQSTGTEPPTRGFPPSEITIQGGGLAHELQQKGLLEPPLPPSANQPLHIQPMIVPLLPGTQKTDQQIKSVEDWGLYRLLNSPVPIDPGQSFMLRNWYQIREQDVQIKRILKLPEGWNAPLFSQELVFSANSVDLDLIKIDPPPKAAAGNYVCELTHECNGVIGAPIALDIEIKPLIKVQINTSPLPPAISQADAVSLNIELQNSGNTPVRLTPNYTSNLEGKVAFTPPSLYLPPGQKGQVKVDASQFVVLGLRNDWILNLKFTSDDGAVLASSSTSCPIFKSGYNRVRTYENSIDTQLQMLYSTNGTHQDLVWQWSGSGYVNAARTRKTDFFLQVPSQNSYGTQDPTYKLRLSLYDLDWRIDGGDTTFVLSPMVQAGFLGRGFRFYKAWNTKQLALFGLKERDYTNNRTKIGSQLGATYSLKGDTQTFTLDFLTKRKQSDSQLVTLSPEQKLWGAQYNVRVGSWGRFLLFFGRNCSDTPFAEEKGRYAYQLGWQTPFKSIWQGSLVWTYQQPGFWGTAQDRKEVSFSFARDFSNLFASFQGYYGRSNLHNTFGESGLITNTYTVALRKDLPHRLKGLLGINYRTRVDRVNLSEVNSSHGISPGLSFSTDRWAFDGTVQIYRACDEIKNYKRFPKWQPQINVNYQLMSNMSLYWHGSWGSDPMQIPFSPNTSNRYGLFWNISDCADLNFSSNLTNSPSQRGQSYTTSLTCRPFADHLAKINYISNGYPRSKNKAYRSLTVNYSIFFSIPSGKSLGSDLRGQVIDELNPKSSHRYIVCLGGYKNLSDSSGRYSFTGIPAGEYPIWLENLPPGMVETTGGISRQKLESGKLEMHNIEVSAASRILGSIQIVKNDKKIKTDEKGQLIISDSAESQVSGFAGALLSLKELEGTTRIAAMTDKNGSFDFGTVHPGKWIVEVVDISLPENTQLDGPKARQIDVLPGKPVDLTWKVVALKRQIRMIN